MVEYTIDDIRGPTVAREMAQLKEFVLARFNGAIADAEAAAAAAATAAANAVLANTVKKTGEASQSIAGDVAITGALDAAAIGSASTPLVCGDLTAFGTVSLDDTVLQGNLSAADASALINLSGVGSVLVPTPSANGEAATKKYVDDADALKISITAINNYAVGLTGNQDPIAGNKTFTGRVIADIAKGRITATDTLDIVTNYDGMNIYYLYMSNVQGVPGVPTGVDGGGAILYHSRIYAYGDTTNNYTFYSQMLISSTGNIYTRRHIMTTNRDTQAVTWGTENWKLQSYTEVAPI